LRGKKNLTEMNYDEIHQWVENHISLDAPIHKLKFKFENAEWQQVNPTLDYFNSYQHVRNVCDENVICWLDSMHYSLLSQTEQTEMLYKFIAHRAGIVREGILDNSWKGVNEDKLSETQAFLTEHMSEITSYLSDMFQFILWFI
jgi:hypothetical protein